MSEEGDKRRSALLRMKMFMGFFFILGFAILLCSGLSTNYCVKRATGVPYFWGGFIVGPMAIINSMLLGNVLVGAMGKSADNDDIKKIASRISCQYSMSTLLFPACLIGSIFTGIWGINYDVEGGQFSTNRALAAVILIGIIPIRSNESGLVIQYNVNVISSDNNRQNVNRSSRRTDFSSNNLLYSNT